MEAKSLWGDIGLDEPLRPPVVVLKEQASILGSITNGILQGEVAIEKFQNIFRAELYIVAPILDGYKINILDITYGIELYPVAVVQIEKGKEGSKTDCDNEEQLIKALADILSSEKVRRIIRALVAQSKAA